MYFPKEMKKVVFAKESQRVGVKRLYFLRRPLFLIKILYFVRKTKVLEQKYCISFGEPMLGSKMVVFHKENQ